jgi:hypothetical protein
MSPQAKRKSSRKKEEPQSSLASENPDERPEADPSQPSEEQEVNQAPAHEQPSEEQPSEEQPPEETDQERFDRENRKAEDESEAEEVDEDENDRSLSPYQPRRLPLESAGIDQHAAEAERQAELAAEREEHNRRTGDASRA